MTKETKVQGTVNNVSFQNARRDTLKKIAGIATAGLAAPALVLSDFASAAPSKLSYKLGISLAPDHPTVVGLKAACADILRDSGGKLAIEVFPAGQLGSDTDMISQVRSGAIDFVSTAGMVWGTLVPVASINVVAFAFPDYQTVWNAMDGELGAYIRGAFSKVNLTPMARIWDHGFRQITTSTKPINTPQDLAGMKLRVPVAPSLTTLFKAVGASPTTIGIGEVYTSLQTRVVDGQENPLAVIDAQKFYEVQKYCSLTGHAWDGFWLVANSRSWNALPEDLRQLASRTFDLHALKQRETNLALNNTLQTSLSKRGLAFNKADGKPFRQTLQNAGFYREWQGRLGNEAWSLLEKYSGKLA